MIAYITDQYFSFYEREYDDGSASFLGNTENSLLIPTFKENEYNNKPINEERKEIAFSDHNYPLLKSNPKFNVNDKKEQYQKIDKIFMVEKVNPLNII